MVFAPVPGFPRNLVLFFFIAFNMVAEGDNDETLNTDLDGTQIENHIVGKTAAVDTRISIAMDDLICHL